MDDRMVGSGRRRGGVGGEESPGRHPGGCEAIEGEIVAVACGRASGGVFSRCLASRGAGASFDNEGGAARSVEQCKFSICPPKTDGTPPVPELPALAPLTATALGYSCRVVLSTVRNCNLWPAAVGASRRLLAGPHRMLYAYHSSSAGGNHKAYLQPPARPGQAEITGPMLYGTALLGPRSLVLRRAFAPGLRCPHA